MSSRYDIAVYGATGFTGQLAARALTADASLKIVIAGRNSSKLEELRKSCKNSPDIFVAEASDEAKIRELVSLSKVIINFAGPFIHYAENLIKACAELGRHYCDITGETVFLADMFSKYHDQAKQTGATLIPMAGFDSVPADIVGYLAVKAARRSGIKLTRLDHYYSMRGGFNGGTLETTMSFGELGIKDKYLNENVLIPDPLWPKVSSSESGPRYEERVKAWTAPFFMHNTNAALYRRARYLSGDMDYAGVPYEERMTVARGAGGYLAALAIEKSVKAMLKAIDFTWGRKILRTLGPSPGEGPSEKSQQMGFYKGILVGREGDRDRIVVKLSANGDPGNIITVMFATEIAKTLLQEKTEVKGFTTATTAFGEVFLERIKSKVVEMRVEVIP